MICLVQLCMQFVGVVCKIGLSVLFLPLFNQATGVFAFFCNQIPDIVTQQVMQTEIGAIHNYGYLAYFLGIASSRNLCMLSLVKSRPNEL